MSTDIQVPASTYTPAQAHAETESHVFIKRLERDGPDFGLLLELADTNREAVKYVNTALQEDPELGERCFADKAEAFNAGSAFALVLTCIEEDHKIEPGSYNGQDPRSIHDWVHCTRCEGSWDLQAEFLADKAAKS